MQGENGVSVRFFPLSSEKHGGVREKRVAPQSREHVTVSCLKLQKYTTGTIAIQLSSTVQQSSGSFKNERKRSFLFCFGSRLKDADGSTLVKTISCMELQENTSGTIAMQLSCTVQRAFGSFQNEGRDSVLVCFRSFCS